MAPYYNYDPDSDVSQLDHLPLATRRRLLISSMCVNSASISDFDYGEKEKDDYWGKQAIGVLEAQEPDGSTGTDNIVSTTTQNVGAAQVEKVDLEASASEISKSAKLRSQTISISESQQAEESIGTESPNKKHIFDTTGRERGLRLTKIECCTSAPMLSQEPRSSIVGHKTMTENLDGNSSHLHVKKERQSAISAILENPSAIVDDDLDHVVLRQRQTMLLERRIVQSKLGNPVLHDHSDSSTGVMRIKREIPSAYEKSLDDDNQFFHTDENVDSYLERSRNGTPLSAHQMKSINETENSRDNAFSELDKDILSSMLRSLVRVKSEPMDESIMQNVGKEPMDDAIMHNVAKPAFVSLDDNLHRVKNEKEICHEPEEDEIDHMTMANRMKLELSDSKRLKTPDLVDTEYSQMNFERLEPLKVHRPWKRKKTATNSVETALEEDVPGLLQILIDQGIAANEIKLYSEEESDDALDESLCEDSFSKLEAVMSKIFFQCDPFIKFPPMRCAKGQKSSYCLDCLFSLVEQARYLQFRKWPVEWGWCRDLQSFIFVFERHKRIVMERPEYGYATYFFELVDSSSISWQIKRLVTAMKLNSCGRVTLIENKPLLVGDDLSEGEAQVLMGFGWLPNTGLGTMLNYRDRVVHDRKHEKDSSDWRSKIAKLLVDGYNDGVIVSTSTAVQSPRGDFEKSSVKLELC